MRVSLEERVLEVGRLSHRSGALARLAVARCLLGCKHESMAVHHPMAGARVKG